MGKAVLRMEKGATIIASVTEINASKEKVWEVLSPIGDIEKFHPLVKKSHAISTVKSGMGAKRHCELLPMGQMVEEVVQWDEGSSFILQVIGGKMLPPYRFMEGKVDLIEIGKKTKVTFSFSYQLKYGILGRLMNALLIRPQFKKAPPQYVAGLKEYVEKLDR
ncbi:SRPBCC family protein [Pareuzebyella sediminis]|uniref:SRPBCC family protein n=1 Tax=Pareuzebyella sediminis TaxID=2607998 RepID=UPI0011EBBD67|nr:SRPBCC family protein [Pareuzebyella sediminis]